jgi:hypothetical protein
MARRRRRGAGSESAGYHYDATPKHPAPTRTPTVAPPKGEAATGPAGDYHGASRDYTKAVEALPAPARKATEAATRAKRQETAAKQRERKMLDLLVPKKGSRRGTTRYKPPKPPKPTSKPPTFEGEKTAGAPTLRELNRASKSGTLKTNRAGYLTTPAVRQATKALEAAASAAQRTTGIQGPLAPEQKRFVRGVAKHTGESPRAVAAQALAEQSGPAATGYEESGEHNYLNIGPGYHFGSNREAVRETSKLLNTSPNYAGIRASRGKSPLAQVRAIGASPWGTVQSTMEGTLPQVSVKRNPKAVKRLEAARAKAKSLGLHSAAPDIEPSKDGHYVFVRADAGAAVKWAQHALGTAEGSSKQVRWAGEQGLSTTQPWCANFVSADLKRHGVPLPPNPNYVPSYESEWNGGRNIGTDLSKAKPGDLIAYSGEHIGIYKGGGKVISGNYGNEVAESGASDGPAPVSAILRPNYKGGKIKLKVGTSIPAYTGGTSITSVPAGTEAAIASREAVAGSTTVRLTPAQKTARTVRELEALGIGQGKKPEPEPSVTLKELEEKYGHAIV